MPQVVYHKLVTIVHADKSQQLKIRSNSTTAAIDAAIRARFGLSDSQRYLLVDKEGCDVIADCTLTTGKYQLELCQSPHIEPARKAVGGSISAPSQPAPAAKQEKQEEKKEEKPEVKEERKIVTSPPEVSDIDPAESEVKKKVVKKESSAGDVEGHCRRDAKGKINLIIIDCEVANGETVDAVENVISYTILEEDPNKIDVQFVYGNQAFAESVEFQLHGWKSSLEILQWIPFEPDKETEMLRAIKGVEVTNMSSRSIRITFPRTITGLFNEGEGSLLIKDKW